MNRSRPRCCSSRFFGILDEISYKTQLFSDFLTVVHVRDCIVVKSPLLVPSLFAAHNEPSELVVIMLASSFSLCYFVDHAAVLIK
ncbi:hypothetical protein H5410_044785 [Solanum commersonii]|uniref:Uncharacterized protein n=1 Tax=Solanum commersonii TaxID=4109 RepID=A0A9J5X9L0_SOLCO|nr:hypothetical protein H5410_044785 [Solanum commersonii]